MSDEPTGRAKGALVLASRMTPEQRSERARKAAAARWADVEAEVPEARFAGVIRVGDVEVPCAVLDDERRVITQLGFLRAIGRGRPRGGSSQGTAGDGLPAFLFSDNLKPFISDDLRRATEPIVFRSPRGGGKGGNRAFGYAAELLPKVCDVYLRARREGALLRQQVHVAEACEILYGALAESGIVGLVDEATGYQAVRSRTALQDIFNAFLRRELAAWVQRFPEDFYRELYRLRGWEWRGMSVGRPQVVAYYTVDLVYSRLLPHIMDELESRMPRTASGRRKGKLHQLFSEDVGHPALAQHIYSVVTLMRVADDGDWEHFMRMLDRAHPRKTDKWLKELMSRAESSGTDEPKASSSAPLPLLELMNAAPAK